MDFSEEYESGSFTTQARPWLGQLVFTVVSFVNAAVPALALFRYRVDSDFYSNGDILTGGNWWSRGNKTLHYGRMIIWGLAFLFQFITVMGQWANINITLWPILIGFFAPIVNLFFMVTQLIALFQAKELARDSSQSSSMILKAETLEAQIEDDLLFVELGAISTCVILYFNSDNWLKGQTNVLSRSYQLTEPITSSSAQHFNPTSVFNI